jgi:actin-related protein
MSSGIIGGDEVGALVLDFGSYTTRAGYAGQDLPMCDFPSVIGVVEELVDKQDAMDDGFSEPSKKNKYFIDTVNIKTPRKNMNLQSYIKDGQSKHPNAHSHKSQMSFTSFKLIKLMILIYLRKLLSIFYINN